MPDITPGRKVLCREVTYEHDGRPRRTEFVVLDERGAVEERYLCVGDHTPEKIHDNPTE